MPMPRTFLATLILAAVPPICAARADTPPTTLRFIVDNPDYKRDITIVLSDAKSGQFTVRWQEGKTVVERSYDRAVRAEFAKQWGDRSFSLRGIPNEDCFAVERRWELRRGSERRTVCRDEKTLRRLGEIQGTVQVLLRD
jgi:hypothetical protein